MASFRGRYFYELSANGSEQYTVVIDGLENPHISIHKEDDPDAIEFQVGDRITLMHGDTAYPYPSEYMGSYEGGVVIRDIVSGYPFLLSDEFYPTDYSFTVDTEPFPVCFVKGTLITTSRGSVAIEQIVTGDLVQGSTGWHTVKWVGWRNYGAASFLTEESKSRIAPVRIRAHAIADNVPSSDLLTSPWHHLFVDSKLVRAGDLVNGTTITQEIQVTEVAYYHVELDQFDVILAHGIYSESWADGGNRSFFQNVDVASLRPEDMQRRRASRPEFDHLVVHTGKELLAIQRRVARRAKAISKNKAKAKKAA